MKGITTFLLFFCFGAALAAPPESDKQAREAVREIHQEIHKGNQTFYCDCLIDWDRKTVNLESCGYETPTSYKNRAKKWEVEHVVPAWELGHNLECWEEGPRKANMNGRRYCKNTNRHFRSMYFNLHNLVPSIGQVNAIRKNFLFTILEEESNYGECEMEIKHLKRQEQPRGLAEPPESARGPIARIYLYMMEEHQGEKYKFELAQEQRDMFNDWNEKYPVTEWECERDRLIAQARYQGENNPKVQEKCTESGL